MHRIRLRGPWRAQWSTSPPRAAVYSRSFHRPTGLTAQQEVRLAVRPSPTDGHTKPDRLAPADVDCQGSQLSVRLNNHRLQLDCTSAEAISQPLDSLLDVFNSLEVACLSAGAAQSEQAEPQPFSELWEVELQIHG